MNQNPESPFDNVIRITAEDARSLHVDDLLKRQASLRGETGISRSGRKKWYYNNWFILAIAGGLGAFVVAALLEPNFDDKLFVRGKIEKIGEVEEIPQIPLGDGQVFQLIEGVTTLAPLHINGEQIWLLSLTKEMQADGSVIPLDLESLKVGDEVGLYVEYAESAPGHGYAVADFMERNPNRPMKAPSLRQLNARQTVVGMLFFPSIAALIGLAIGAADGMVCRLWRRAFLGGGVGMLIGFVGGFVAQFLAGLIYVPLNELAMAQQVGGLGKMSTMGFLTQVSGRGVAWCLTGMAMGLGQGVAMRSGRLLLYGLLGGAIGGLLGGILFDPIDLVLLGADKPSAHLSRLIGVTIIGLTVGFMIGIVELLARDAWLQMLKGPLSGKEFLIFKDVVHLGSSPKSDIYLFNDPGVAERHAVIRTAADQYELEVVRGNQHQVFINGRPVERTRLHPADQITLGETVFSFQRRKAN